MSIPVITIDGPSGSGKGTISQLLANALGFHILDSGAIYRLAALSCLQRDVVLEDEAAVLSCVQNLSIQFKAEKHNTHAFLDAVDVTQQIRQEIVGMGASTIAAYPSVRQALLARQRAFLSEPGLVADGRDMGTVVFPSAQVKIFLQASAEKRAERRYRQLTESGYCATIESLLKDIRRRDEQDSVRSTSPMVPAAGAYVIDSTDLSIVEVLEKVMVYVNQQLVLVD